RDELLLSAERVVLWFEHDLYDQLQLLEALSIRDDVELIVVGEFLGPLDVDELEALWPRRVRASIDASEAWAAVRAPEPTRLAEAGEVDGLPFVRPAVRRLLEELPWAGDGLSRTERQALRVVADGATSPHRAFVESQRLEEAAF